MAVIIKSIKSYNELISEIYTFAVSAGWIGLYKTTSTDDPQIGLKLNDIYYYMGRKMYGTGLDYLPKILTLLDGSKYSDFRMGFSLGTGFSKNINRYKPQPGMVGSIHDTGCWFNDLGPPYKKVWFFSSNNSKKNYIHVVVQTNEERFCHLIFGELTNCGENVPQSGYITAPRFVLDPAAYQLPMSFQKQMSSWFTTENIQIYIKPGVVKSDFTTASIYQDSTVSLAFNQHKLYRYRLLDVISQINNSETTGGVPLFTMPCILYDSEGASKYNWLGEYPDIRLCTLSNLDPGQEISYGGETWIVFPIKKKTNPGDDVYPYSGLFGLAYKKTN